MSPVKHINVIKGKFYYGFKCQINNENCAFLLLSSIQWTILIYLYQTLWEIPLVQKGFIMLDWT